MGFLSYGIPLLNEYRVPATSFLIGVNDGENKVRNNASAYVAFESHSYNMHRPGGNIGHGGVISALSKEEIEDDLLRQPRDSGKQSSLWHILTETLRKSLRKRSARPVSNVLLRLNTEKYTEAMITGLCPG